MSQMQEIRSFYLDSQWTQRNANGSFSLLLDEQIEVPNGSVMYLDEVSVIGSIPMVNLNNQKLYVVEQTPTNFNFQGQVKASASIGAPTTNILVTAFASEIPAISQYKYQADIPLTLHNKVGKLLFVQDDTECVWAGILFHLTQGSSWDPNNLPNDFEEVSAKFLYTTGVATWSSRMGDYRFFDYGPVDWRSGGSKDTLRILNFPVGEYEAQSFRDTLGALLNDGAFAGTIPEGSGTTYLVEGTGTDVRVRTNETATKRQDAFVILGEKFLSNVMNTRYFTTTWAPENPQSIKCPHQQRRGLGPQNVLRQRPTLPGGLLDAHHDDADALAHGGDVYGPAGHGHLHGAAG